MNNHPSNISECFDVLDSIVTSSEDQNWFKDSSENDVVLLTHNGLGEWIRNNWNLWNKNSILYLYFNKLGLSHADDMSTLIIRSYHRMINNKELDIIEQVNKFTLFWENKKKSYGPI